MASTESPFVTGFQDNNDNGGNQPRSDCLGTPVVLRIIMEHLSNKDLLAISLVNKLWNYEARSVLKNRGTLIATLSSLSPCQKVGAFASDLRQMNVVPFSGISIQLAAWLNCQGCEASSTGALDPSYCSILDRVQWKCLRLWWGKRWENDQKCQAFLLAQRILQDFSGNLEEVKVRLPDQSQKFMQQVLRDFKFPQLKLLDLSAALKAEDEDCTALTKALLSRAPRLQEFHEYNWVNLEGNVMEGSGAVLITHRPIEPAYEELSEAALATLRVVDVTLGVTEQDFSVERFNRIMPLLLDNSKTRLKQLCMDAVFALPLMCCKVQLETVTTLRLRLDYNYLELTHPRVLTFLKAFDFTRTFPNLSKVSIDSADVWTLSHHMGPERVNELILQGNPLLPNVPIQDTTANIKELSLTGHIEDNVIPFLVQMFPITTTLTINRSHGRELPYGLIWEHFRNLEKLVILKFGDYYRKMWPRNLDGVFCGIFPEEVAQLMEKDDEYLRNVNIVPVMPAVTCLRGLKDMEISIWNKGFGNPGDLDGPLALGDPPTREYGPTFLFSKVTGLTVFARMPTLSIKIYICGDIPDIERAMSHLKPYATVSLGGTPK